MAGSDLRNATPPYYQVTIASITWIILVVLASVFMPIISTPLIYVYYGVTAFIACILPCFLFGLICLDYKKYNWIYGYALLLSDPVGWFVLLSPAVVYTKLPILVTAQGCMRLLGNGTSCVAVLAHQRIFSWPIISEPWGVPRELKLEQLSHYDIENHLSLMKSAIYVFVFMPVLIRSLYSTGLVSHLVHVFVITHSTIQTFDLLSLMDNAYTLPFPHVRMYSDGVVVFATIAVITTTSTLFMVTSYMVSQTKKIYDMLDVDQEMIEFKPKDQISIALVESDTTATDKKSTAPIGKTYMLASTCVSLLFVDIPFGCLRIFWLIQTPLSIFPIALLAKNCMSVILFFISLCIYSRRSLLVENDSYMAKFSNTLQTKLQCRCLFLPDFSYAWSVGLCVIASAMTVLTFGTVIIFICVYSV